MGLPRSRVEGFLRLKTRYNTNEMDEKLTGRANEVAKKFALGEEVRNIEPFGQGRINDTFLVTTESGERYVLQRVNPIFAPSVLFDIEAITRELKQRGFATTELVPTKSGEPGVIENKECWRMLIYVPGRTIEEGATKAEVRSAMELIGAFHKEFAELQYNFRHVREGFHDTPKIMEGLEKSISEYRETKKDAALGRMGEEILDAYVKHPHAWMHLPKRIVHGDLKLSNVRFDLRSPKALALLDLDTLGRQSVLVDIADAVRSWGNPKDEGDEYSYIDLDTLETMMEGYKSSADFLTSEELQAIPHAITQMTLELAARFATDAYRESYFKLDRERYPDLFTQNLAKARAQFALYCDIVSKLPHVTDLTTHI